MILVFVLAILALKLLLVVGVYVAIVGFIERFG
jgi:hypothetical protein